MNNQIIIIGGGSSALMLASLLPKKSDPIIESNAKFGAKILISGGGKCNITNEVMGSDYFLGDPEVVTQQLKKFDEKAHAAVSYQVKGQHGACRQLPAADAPQNGKQKNPLEKGFVEL